MKRFVSYLLVTIIVLGLPGCAGGKAENEETDPITIVKNGSLSQNPNLPIAESFQNGFTEANMIVTSEEWEVTTETWASTLGLKEDQEIVRCEYNFDNDDIVIIQYQANMKTEKITIFSFVRNGEILTEAEIEEFLDAFLK